MSRVSRLMLAAVGAAAIATGLVACGDDDDGGSSGDSSVLIHGTTDQPVSYDPAGSYDLPSYNVIFNVYQNLLQIPPGGNKPEPEIAESCDFTDDSGQVYECTLQSGLKFSDGSDLTSEDVKVSFERNLEIADPQGASSIYLEPEEHRDARRHHGHLQPQGAGRDLALPADHGRRRDRAGRVPGRQGPALATR